MRAGLLLVVLPLLSACTHYEFDLLQPEEFSAHVGRSAKNSVSFERPPLHYHLQAYEGRLVMQIANPTDQPIEILGGRSFAVDPAGQSHPIPSQAIGPHSFIRLVFPPLWPMYAAPGYVVYRGWGFYEWCDYPPYALVPAGPPELYWEWKDSTMAKVHLVFREGEKTIEQEFVFARKKT